MLMGLSWWVTILPWLARDTMGASILHRHFLPTGICADGTPGAYYISSNSSSSDYVVYIMGGGGCAHDESTCEVVTDPLKFSSNGLPDTMDAYGPLSGDIYENPLYATFNRVFVHYCTQDMYLLDTESSDGLYQFRGRLIIEETMRLLFGSLDQEVSVVLIGSSAGGVGAFNAVSWMLDSFDMVTDISVIIDSAILVDAGGYMEGMLNLVKENPSIAYSPSCSQEFRGGPCCAQFICMVLNKHYPIDLLKGTFIIQTAQDGIPATRFIDEVKVDNIWDVAVYTETLESDLRMLADLFPSSLSIFSPRCIDHHILRVGGDRRLTLCEDYDGYEDYENGIVTDCVYDESGHVTGISRSVFLFENSEMALSTTYSVNAWNSIQIEGTSVRTAMRDWWDGMGESGNQVALFDTCNSINCNPTCLSRITPGTREQSDSVLVLTIALGVCLFAIVITGVYVLSIAWGLQWATRASCTVTSYLGEKRNKVVHEGIAESAADGVPVIEWRALSYWIQPGGCAKYFPSRDIYRGKKILHCVHGEVPEGSLCSIMGPTGSGKSTLLDLLTGRRDFGVCTGDLLFAGKSISDKGVKEEYFSQSGYMRQLQYGYLEDLSVLENLIFAVQMRCPGDFEEHTKKIQAAIENTNLEDNVNTKAVNLSGGLKRRLSLAMELLSNRKILFLDEPTSGLDACGSLVLMKMLKRLSTEMTIIVSIHQPRPEIWNLFSHSIILKSGRIVFSGPADEALQGVTGLLPRNITQESEHREECTRSESETTTVGAYGESSVPDMIMDALMTLDGDSCFKVDGITPRKKNTSLILDAPAQHSGTVDKTTPKWRIAATIMARRWRGGYAKQLSFGFKLLLVCTFVVAFTFRNLDLESSIPLLVTSVLITNMLPMNIVYAAILIRSMGETWGRIRVELQDGFYPSVCAIFAMVVDQIAICALASFLIVIVMFTTFWGNYVDDLPTEPTMVFGQMFCAYFLMGCVSIGIMISLSISGLEFTRVRAIYRAISSLWFLFSGTLLPISSLPASLSMVTYASPVFWSTNFVLRIILDGLDRSSSCTTVSHCATQYGDVIANQLELHRFTTEYNIVTISVFAVGCISIMVATIKYMCRRRDTFDSLGNTGGVVGNGRWCKNTKRDTVWPR